MRSLRARTAYALEGAPATVVMLSANPMHDTGGGQRSAQLTLELLEAGYAVVFVSHGRVTESVDLRLRFDGPRLVETTMKAFTGPAGASTRALLWDRGVAAIITQVPARAWLPVLEEGRRAGAVTVYDCVDRWDSELGAGWYREGVERRVARDADLVMASAPELVRRLEQMAEREVRLLPNAYNGRIFDASVQPDRPADLPLGRVALYVGALWGGWFHWDLVRRAAEAHPDEWFVFIGDYRDQGAGLPANCVFLGLKAQIDLPPYLAHADLAVVPWVRDDVTEATSPLKVYEFVAMGLPVVAPRLDPLTAIPGVHLACDEEKFVHLLGTVGRGRNSVDERRAMADFSRDNSWAHRVETLVGWIDEAAASGDPHGSPSDTTTGRDRGTVLPRGERTRVRSRDRDVVSVVIPSYNHERFIGQAVESVLGQTLPCGDLVVVDDGSSDGSRDVLAGYAGGVAKVIHQVNRGAHHAINRAIARSEGEYVAILNSDDVFAPERVEHAWGVARASGAALVIGSVRWIDADGGDLPRDHPGVSWYRTALAEVARAPSLRRAALRHNFAVTTSNFFLHRALWRALGGFRAFRYVHDLDFLVRALELCGDRVVFAPELEDVSYRIHGGNTIAESTERALAERARLVRALRAPVGHLGRRLARVRGGIGHAVDATTLLRPLPPAAAREGSLEAKLAHDGPRQGAQRVSQPLRVGLVVHSLGLGGLEEMVALLARILPTLGVAPFVLCTHRGGPIASRLADSGVPVALGEGRPALWRAWLRGVSPDVLSTHFVDLEALEVLAEHGVPVVETVQNCYAWFTADDWNRERAKGELLAGTVAVSDLVARYHAKGAGLGAGGASGGALPSWVIPNAVDPGRAAAVPRAWARRALDLSPTAPVVVHHGRLARQKNVVGLLRAFTQVVHALPDATLLLAGPKIEPAYVSEIRRAARGLFRAGRVRILPPVQHVGAFLSAADAFVANSFFEGWSVSASEAAWVGVPLVLSECGGSAELVGDDGARGRMVPNPVGDPMAVDAERIRRPPEAEAAGNEVAMAEALVAVLADRERWHDRAPAIRAHARTALSPWTMGSAYAEMFRSLAGRGS